MKYRAILLMILVIAGCQKIADKPNFTTLSDSCISRSNLECSKLIVTPPYTLSFSGDEGGLTDQAELGTGFTMVDPPSSYIGSDADKVTGGVLGYAPSNLSIANGELHITATRGINARTSTRGGNSQLNALGVQFDATREQSLATTLTNLPSVSTSASYEQSGLWFGLNEANFVKLVVINSVADSGGKFDRIQLSYEANDATSATLERQRALNLPTGSSVQLKLTLDPATNTVTAFYSTDEGLTFVEIGSLSVSSTLFTDFHSYGGIFTSSRLSNAPTTFSFANFYVGADKPDSSIALQNLDGRRRGDLVPGFYDDHLVFNRIGGGLYGGMKFHEASTLRIINTGERSALQISNLSISPAFTLPKGETSLTLSPGEAYDLEVAFVEDTGAKGVRRGTLTLNSNAINSSAQTVTLFGMYMVTPEGSRELSPQQIANTFDYRIYIPMPLSSEPDSPLAGSEVRSKFWTRADASKLVYVRQLAAFHGCCTSEDYFQITGTGGGSFRHLNVDGQSVLPRKSSSQDPAEMLLNPTSSRFELRIAGYSTNTSGALGVRLWPVRTRDNRPLKDTYLVIQDFVQNGCGAGSANCDYNDNMYLVTNIKPSP